MVHGAVRHLFQLIGAGVVVVLAAAPLLVWRLSNGPLNLDLLTPYIEQGLSARDGSLSVRLDRTALALGGDERLLEMHAYNVRAYVAGQDTPIASFPDMGLSLSGRALLHGVLAPHSIRVIGARVRLVRGEDGRVLWGIGDVAEVVEPPLPGTMEPSSADAGAVVAAVKDALLGTPDPSKPGRTLQAVSIRGADLMVEDRMQKASWHAPQVDITVRRVPDGVAAKGRAALELSGEKGQLALDAAYHRLDGSVDAALRLEGIRPAVLAGFGGPLIHLGVLDMPLSGAASLRLLADGQVERAALDLSGGAGHLDLPAPISARHDVTRAGLKAELTRNMTRLDLSELQVDMGGALLQLNALAEGLGGDTSITAEGSLRDVPVDRVRDLWPAGLADNARDWVVPNLSKGVVKEATIALAVRSPSGRFDDVVIDKLGGTVRPEGVTVDYLHPMPVARNVSADCSYDTNSFRIALKGGEVFGLRLKEGAIAFTGLDNGQEFADIDLSINGPATDALKLIDSQPLRYAQALGIQPARVSGDAQTRLRLKFPLLKALRLDDVQVKANATVKSVRIPAVMMGLDLEDGTLALEVDAKGLDATGPVVLAGIPGTLAWRENFSKGQAFRSRYILKSSAVSEESRKVLGLDGPPFTAPFTAGPVAGEVTATFMDGGRGEIDAKVDLSPAAMTLPGLGWVKEAGKPGTADVLVILDRSRVAAVPHFEVKAAGGMDTAGSAAFVDGRLKKVEFARLAYGRTLGSGTLSLRPDKSGLDVTFTGESFDAQPALTRSEAEKRGERPEKPPPMTVTASARRLWVSDKGAVTDAAIVMSRDAEDWQSISLRGLVGDGKPFSATIAPGGPKRRTFSLVSSDAGAVLRTFDVFDDLNGGELSVEGHIDDTKPNQPFIGVGRITDYHVRNAPVLARLLTVVAMTGILDILQGQGISFSSLEAPFTLADGLLDVHDGRAWGPALGLTAKGQVDMDNSRMALEGTVVPAYVFNSVLGNIPVLGWLITGGDKGGGVIAFNYSMKGQTSDPSVLVNPLSALTPGFLRKLFNIFDDGSSTDARKGTEKARQ